MRPHIEILPNPARLAEAAAGHILRSAEGALAQRQAFTLALSGGATPRAAYRRLAELASAKGLAWERVQLFWGDERCVPPEAAQSNYRLARHSLLDRIPIPPANIHRMPGELEPEAAARAYEDELRMAFFGGRQRPSHAPRFDLILLGLGGDGHTASLFPGSSVLTESERWVAAQPPVDHGVWRLTLTLPVINAAAEVLFLVSGRDKADILQRALHGPHDPNLLPAQAIQPIAGELIWLVDAPAASLL